VTEAEVSWRITEVLGTIAPMSHYFCREPEGVEDVQEDIYAGPTATDGSDAPEHTEQHSDHSGSDHPDPGHSDSDDHDSADSRTDDDDGARSDHSDLGSGSGSDSDSDSGSDRSGGDEDHDHDEGGRGGLPRDIVNVSQGNTDTSDFVKKPRPSALTGEHVQRIKRGWDTTKDYASSAVNGMKMMFGKKGGDGGDTPGSDGDSND
jgi:hypothetical protein